MALNQRGVPTHAPNKRNALLNARVGKTRHLRGREREEKGEGEEILPIEVKAFTQCKRRLLLSLGSACSMSWNVLFFY